MILAGDIGGTHTRLALFEQEPDGGPLKILVEQVYPSHEHESLGEIVALFMSDQDVISKSAQHAHAFVDDQHGRSLVSYKRMWVDHACFGIAGPVLKNRAVTPNLPWVVDGSELSQQVAIPDVQLINDLQAHASGIYDLNPSDLATLNPGDGSEGNAALIAAGTGLGEAGLYWDGARRWPFPCEGGHTDFAPRNDLEIALLRYLLKKFDRISYERVLSGPGLQNIYEFLRDTGVEPEPQWLKETLVQAAAKPAEGQHSADPVAVISDCGMQAKAGICERALDIFVSIYGAEAGNLALKIMALGGVFVSGGIAAKILPRLTTPLFREAFVSKGRLSSVMETIPVKVVMDDKVGLIGAARYACLHASK